jgi:hypothetical protein
MNTISSHDAFFQKFIDIIPKEIYENDDTIEINTKYYKHRKVPLTADEKKVLSKKRLKEKYRNSMVIILSKIKAYSSIKYSFIDIRKKKMKEKKWLMMK